MKGRLRIDFVSLLPLIVFLLIGLFVNFAESAPALDEEDAEGGCYYMFKQYGEGDRILTNEPCLNCTCHNSMLMCYLRVCPFTKPIGQDCTIEKKADQCCPVISCPEEDVRIHTDQKKLLVPVALVTPSAPSSTTPSTTSLAPISDSTELSPYGGCEMNGKYYPDGAQVDGDPEKPCELCYCIRNRTACVMQECILHVEGCEPVFQPGVCCPVRYRCDYPPEITGESSTMASLIPTTIMSIFQTTPQPGGCMISGEYYADGSRIPGAERSPCEHCYCMRGEPVCAVQECGAPMENVGNCTAVPPPPGHCCPEKFTCEDTNEMLADDGSATGLPVIAETTETPTPQEVSDSAVPASDSKPDVIQGSTELPIEPVGVTDADVPVQADETDESQTVPPTALPAADEKIETSTSLSPVSESDAPPAPAVIVPENDAVQTPTEQSIPPTVFPAEAQPAQDSAATEASSIGSEDSETHQNDQTSSSSPSSSTTEEGETIFGTTVQPDTIPSENLQLPSSDRPSDVSQDEPEQTSTIASISDKISTSQSTSPSTTSKPDEIQIIDIGSGSSEEQKPESSVSTTARPETSDSPSSGESVSSDDRPVETTVRPQGDQASVGTTVAPSADAKPTDSLPEDNSPAQDSSATTIAPESSFSDAGSLQTTQGSVQNDGVNESGVVSTEAPSVPSSGDELSNDDPSSADSAVPQSTITPPAEEETINDGQQVAGQTTMAPLREAATELPTSSSNPIAENISIATDEAQTSEAAAPEVPTEPSLADDASKESNAESNLPITTSSPIDPAQDPGSQSTNADAEVSITTGLPPLQDDSSKGSNVDSGVSVTTFAPSSQADQESADPVLTTTSSSTSQQDEVSQDSGVPATTSSSASQQDEVSQDSGVPATTSSSASQQDDGSIDSGVSVTTSSSAAQHDDGSADSVSATTSSSPAQQDQGSLDSEISPTSASPPTQQDDGSINSQEATTTSSSSVQQDGSSSSEDSGISQTTLSPSQSNDAAEDTSDASVATTSSSIPPVSQQQDEPSTVLPIAADKPVNSDQIIDQPTTQQSVLPDEPSVDNEILSDPVGEIGSTPSSTEQPIVDISAENTATEVPATQEISSIAPSGTEVVSSQSPVELTTTSGQLADEVSQISTASPGSHDDSGSVEGSTELPVGNVPEVAQDNLVVTEAQGIVTESSAPVVAPVQHEPSRTETPPSSATALPEDKTTIASADVSADQPAESDPSPSQSDTGTPDSQATTAAPEQLPDRITTIGSDSNNDVAIAQSTQPTVQDEPESISQNQQDQALSTDSPTAGPSDEEPLKDATQPPSATNVPEMTTKSSPISSVEDVAEVSSVRPEVSESQTETSSIVQDEPETVTEGQTQSSSSAPDVTTLGTDSESSSSTETVPSDTQSDKTATSTQPEIDNVATTKVPSIDIISDEPETVTSIQLDEVSSSSTDSGLPVDTSTSSPVAPADNVIGVESVSNSPDGSESLMMKTSTLAPESTSSVSPIDVVSSGDNEIVSDGSSMEGEQNSSGASASSEPSSESSSSTSAPSGDSDESTSSLAPSNDPVSSDYNTTPAVAPPVSESSTENSSSNIPESNEIPTGAIQDAPEKIMETNPVTTVSPQDNSEAQDIVTSTATPPSPPSSDDNSSSSGAEAPTTASPQQSADSPSVDEGISSGDSSSINEESNNIASTSQPSVEASTQADEFVPATTLNPIASGTGSTSDEQTGQDQVSNDSADQGNEPVTTANPITSDDSQPPATEPIPVPAQPEEGIQSVVHDENSNVPQGQTTPSSENIASGIKDQTVDAQEQDRPTTVFPDSGSLVSSSSERPQELFTEQPVVSDDSSAGGEPVVTTSAPSSISQHDETIGPVTSTPEIVSVTTVKENTDMDAPSSDAKPVESVEPVPVTTLSPSMDETVDATTARPVSIQESSTESVAPPAPQPSPSADEAVPTTTAASTQAIGGNQGLPQEDPVATTVAPQESAQAPTDEDSQEKLTDDTTGDEHLVDGSSEFTASPPESVPPHTEPSVPVHHDAQSNDATTPAVVPETESDKGSSPASTQRPDIASEGQADQPAQTELPAMITEQPISMQPDTILGMISSTEKISSEAGTTTASSLNDDTEVTTESNVPGEGSCFVEGKTYRNGSSIPPTTPCHIACACKNSVVHCLLVHCPPPPAQYVDCKPIYRSGVCCPEYDCGTTVDDENVVTVTPVPAFPGSNDENLVTVTPEQTSTPSSTTLVSQQQSSERPTSESIEGIHDQPSEDGGAGEGIGISTTFPPQFPTEQSSDPSLVTTARPPSESVSSTESDSLEAHHDSTEASAVTTTTTTTSTTTKGPSDIEQNIDSSSSSPSEMVDSGSAIAPEDDQSLSSTTGPPAGSQYPVTTTTTVTPSTAPWPYPTSSTPPPGAMSSGACLFDGRVYMSAQQIPREDPCDFCFCFRGDIICLQQSCPPPIPGCYEEPIPGFCCPRYECPVGNGNHTTPPPLFPPSYYHNQLLNNAANNGPTGSGSGLSMPGSVPSGPGCEIQGEYFETGQIITSTSGPCLECRCGSTGMMECDPRECQPEPMLRKMIAAITSRRR